MPSHDLSLVCGPALLACRSAVASVPVGSPVRVAVVGSRRFPRLSLVSSFVAQLPSSVVVCSGGAGGVDQTAVSAAWSRGLAVSVLPAAWSRLGRSAGVVRSAQLLSSVSVVVVFLCCGSPGASHAVALASLAGVPVFVVPCGCVASPKLGD